jgi:hypothetical protein
MAVLLPAAFLDERGMRLQEQEGRQHFQYVGGEGGTGKSRVIHAIKDMFRLKDCLHTLLLTGASGNAAALIGGVTLHSAANIGFEGQAATTKNITLSCHAIGHSSGQWLLPAATHFDQPLLSSELSSNKKQRTVRHY